MLVKRTFLQCSNNLFQKWVFFKCKLCFFLSIFDMLTQLHAFEVKLICFHWTANESFIQLKLQNLYMHCTCTVAIHQFQGIHVFHSGFFYLSVVCKSNNIIKSIKGEIPYYLGTPGHQSSSVFFTLFCQSHAA